MTWPLKRCSSFAASHPSALRCWIQLSASCAAAGMQTALMQEIQRQKDPHLREAVALAAKGEAAASLASVEDVREIKDDRERHAAIARDYAHLSAEERSRTIVVSGTNEARREINCAIREHLGLAGHGHEYSILVRRDTAQTDRAFAKNYTPGETVQPERDYPRLGLERGVLYEITENGPGNRLSLRDDKGNIVEFTPRTQIHLSVYEPERVELARAIGCGSRETMLPSTSRTATAHRRRGSQGRHHAPRREARGRAASRPAAARGPRLRHHSSQQPGHDAERVLIDAATRSRTTGQDVHCVAIGRARQEARIYTDDGAKLPLAVSRERWSTRPSNWSAVVHPLRTPSTSRVRVPASWKRVSASLFRGASA